MNLSENPPLLLKEKSIKEKYISVTTEKFYLIESSTNCFILPYNTKH